MDKFIIEKTIKKIKGRSIFLIGMMGCGKSQTGPKLAQLLSCLLYTSDAADE